MRVPFAILWVILASACTTTFASEKFVRLRNETIQTAPKPPLQALAAADHDARKGLWLIQFEGSFQERWAEALKDVGVELVRPVPDDAYVVHLNNTRLAQIKALPFVRWVGPYQAAHKMHERVAGLLPDATAPVRILLRPNLPAPDRFLATRRIPGARMLSQGRFGSILEGRVNLAQVRQLAQSDAVLWIEPAFTPKLVDALAAQIVAGPVDSPRTTATHDLGFTGEGVTVAVADSGLMEGTVENMHPDLAGRVTAFFHYGRLEDASDEHSHGTHVAGIVAGDGAAGETDEEGYLYGLGVAPKANIIAQRIFDGLGGYEAPPTFETMTRDAVRAGAEIGSNSWGDDTQGRYDISAMEFDALVRDADAQTPGDQQYILEFSAGNAGPGARTIGSPAVAKNVIASGASQNNRVEFILWAEGQETMADFSSRGPAEDGRIKPDVVAPGTWIASLQSSFATDENAWLPISANYMYQGGTSQSGPAVSGAAAVFVQFYRETHNGQTPSPALVKAALINSAVDMDDADGTAPVPNHDEGWGRVDLTALVGPDLGFEFLDQTELLRTGQAHEKRILIADPEIPLKITLTYTDVPGFPAAIPALVNDLDLEVVSPSGVVYRGNQFLNGVSIGSAPSHDRLNNVEGVHLFTPEAGEYIVRVRAHAVLEDARRDTAAVDQDFALVISGGVPFPGQAYIIPDRRAYTAPATVNIRVIDFDQVGQPSVNIVARTTTEPTGLPATLLASGSSGVFTGAVQLAAGPATADALLRAKHGDTLTLQYVDVSSGSTITATTPIDTVAPVISGISVTNQFAMARIDWRTDEMSRGFVQFGPTTAFGSAITNNTFALNHLVRIPDLVEGQTYFYRISAEDTAGNLSVSPIQSFVAVGAPPILLVDAYSRTADDESPVIPVTEYTQALDATGIAYDVWNVSELGSPSADTLRPYRIVMWRINDSFYDSTSITLEQETAIRAYLNNGGSFFMASMELLSRLGPSSFRSDVLQVAEFATNPDFFGDCPECDEDHGAPAISGNEFDGTSSGIDVTLDYQNYPVFDFVIFEIGPDVSDTFVPGTNAVSILTEPSGRTVGIRSPRAPQDGQGRVVFLSFPLDAVPMTGPAPNTRPELLRKIFGFLAPGLNGIASLSLDNESYTLPSQLNIELGDSDLAGQKQISVKVVTDTTPQGVTVNLAETVRPGIFRGFIALVGAKQPIPAAEILAKEGDTVRVEYNDVSANAVATASAYIDTEFPAIVGVISEPSYEDVTITWETDELADSLVQYGESTFLGRTAYRGQLSLDHELLITGLQPARRYYYQVVSRDQAGNTTVDNNNGKFYTFDTLTPLPTPYHENFEGGQGTWDIFTDTDLGFKGWDFGVPQDHPLTEAAHSGTNVWATNLRNERFDSAHMFLISPAIQLSQGSSASLKFWHNYDFTGPSVFEFGSLLLFTNTQTQPITLKQYGEFTAGWEEEVIDLTPHVGRVVQLVWEYLVFDIEGEAPSYWGWMVDDVSVTTTSGPTSSLTVTTLAQARFNVTGPRTFTGVGPVFTAPNAPAGQYTVTFEPVPYYNTPAPQTAVVAPGGSAQITGAYTLNDVNQNQIADVWEQEYPSATGDATRRSDSDGDGASDYAEFIAGTIPNNASSTFRLLTPMPIGSDRVQLRWFSGAGRAYRVVSSSDGVIWKDESGWIRANGSEQTYTVSGMQNFSTLFRVEVQP